MTAGLALAEVGKPADAATPRAVSNVVADVGADAAPAAGKDAKAADVAPAAAVPADPEAATGMVIRADMTLDEMKKAFADLMAARAGLNQRASESRHAIIAARDTTGHGPGATSPTAEAYRQAVMRVENALDAHPRIVALRNEDEALRKERVAISRKQADVLEAWRNEAKSWKDQHEARVAKISEQFTTDQAELLKQAKVKDIGQLGERDREHWRGLHARMTNEIALSSAEYRQASDTNAVAAARQADGSRAAFDEANASYGDIDGKRNAIKSAVGDLRRSLRTDDPAIAALEQAAAAAGREHLAAMEATPAARAASGFLARVNGLRAGIDARARILRRRILAADPDALSTLNAQATTGGLALVGDTFWQWQSEQERDILSQSEGAANTGSLPAQPDKQTGQGE